MFQSLGREQRGVIEGYNCADQSQREPHFITMTCGCCGQPVAQCILCNTWKNNSLSYSVAKYKTHHAAETDKWPARLGVGCTQQVKQQSTSYQNYARAGNHCMHACHMTHTWRCALRRRGDKPSSKAQAPLTASIDEGQHIRSGPLDDLGTAVQPSGIEPASASNAFQCESPCNASATDMRQ